MDKYSTSTRKVGNNITESNTIIRSHEYEQKRPELIYSKINNEDYENIKHNGETDEVNTSPDHVLFAEDTSI